MCTMGAILALLLFSLLSVGKSKYIPLDCNDSDTICVEANGFLRCAANEQGRKFTINGEVEYCPPNSECQDLVDVVCVPTNISKDSNTSTGFHLQQVSENSEVVENVFTTTENSSTGYAESSLIGDIHEPDSTMSSYEKLSNSSKEAFTHVRNTEYNITNSTSVLQEILLEQPSSSQDNENITLHELLNNIYDANNTESTSFPYSTDTNSTLFYQNDLNNTNPGNSEDLSRKKDTSLKQADVEISQTESLNNITNANSQSTKDDSNKSLGNESYPLSEDMYLNPASKDHLTRKRVDELSGDYEYKPSLVQINSNISNETSEHRNMSRDVGMESFQPLPTPQETSTPEIETIQLGNSEQIAVDNDSKSAIIPVDLKSVEKTNESGSPPNQSKSSPLNAASLITIEKENKSQQDQNGSFPDNLSSNPSESLSTLENQVMQSSQQDHSLSNNNVILDTSDQSESRLGPSNLTDIEVVDKTAQTNQNITLTSVTDIHSSNETSEHRNMSRDVEMEPFQLLPTAQETSTPEIETIQLGNREQIAVDNDSNSAIIPVDLKSVEKTNESESPPNKSSPLNATSLITIEKDSETQHDRNGSFTDNLSPNTSESSSMLENQVMQSSQQDHSILDTSDQTESRLGPSNLTDIEVVDKTAQTNQNTTLKTVTDIHSSNEPSEHRNMSRDVEMESFQPLPTPQETSTPGIETQFGIIQLGNSEQIAVDNDSKSAIIPVDLNRVDKTNESESPLNKSSPLNAASLITIEKENKSQHDQNGSITDNLSSNTSESLSTLENQVMQSSQQDHSLSNNNVILDTSDQTESRLGPSNLTDIEVVDKEAQTNQNITLTSVTDIHSSNEPSEHRNMSRDVEMEPFQLLPTAQETSTPEIETIQLGNREQIAVDNDSNSAIIPVDVKSVDKNILVGSESPLNKSSPLNAASLITIEKENKSQQDQNGSITDNLSSNTSESLSTLENQVMQSSQQDHSLSNNNVILDTSDQSGSRLGPSNLTDIEVVDKTAVTDIHSSIITPNITANGVESVNVTNNLENENTETFKAEAQNKNRLSNTINFTNTESTKEADKSNRNNSNSEASMLHKITTKDLSQPKNSFQSNNSTLMNSPKMNVSHSVSVADENQIESSPKEFQRNDLPSLIIFETQERGDTQLNDSLLNTVDTLQNQSIKNHLEMESTNHTFLSNEVSRVTVSSLSYQNETNDHGDTIDHGIQSENIESVSSIGHRDKITNHSNGVAQKPTDPHGENEDQQMQSNQSFNSINQGNERTNPRLPQENETSTNNSIGDPLHEISEGHGVDDSTSKTNSSKKSSTSGGGATEQTHLHTDLALNTSSEPVTTQNRPLPLQSNSEMVSSIKSENTGLSSLGSQKDHKEPNQNNFALPLTGNASVAENNSNDTLNTDTETSPISTHGSNSFGTSSFNHYPKIWDEESFKETPTDMKVPIDRSSDDDANDSDDTDEQNSNDHSGGKMENKFSNLSFDIDSSKEENESTESKELETSSNFRKRQDSKESNESTESVLRKKFHCYEEGTFGHPRDSRKFFVCSRQSENGELKMKGYKCPKFRVFDPVSLQCVGLFSSKCV